MHARIVIQLLLPLHSVYDVQLNTEWLHLKSQAVKQLQYPLLHSVMFLRLQGKKVVSFSYPRNASSSELTSTTVSIVIVVQLPRQLN